MESPLCNIPFLTRFHPDSVGFPYMSDWLWVATFSLSQCHRQACEFISNTLGLAPELASSSVPLWGKTRLKLTFSEAYGCMLFSQGLEAKKKTGSYSAYTAILKRINYHFLQRKPKFLPGWCQRQRTYF